MGEAVLGPHHLRRDAVERDVELGELVVALGGPHQVPAGVYDRAIDDLHQTDRAGTPAEPVRGLEVDCAVAQRHAGLTLQLTAVSREPSCRFERRSGRAAPASTGLPSSSTRVTR